MSNKNLKPYLLKPKAPLIIRSGRPFDEISGIDAARFPPPSTMAGALRTAHALSTNKELNLELAKIQVAGPLPVTVNLDGEPVSILVPKPADAHYYYKEGLPQLVRASPKAFASHEGSDLKDGLLPLQLEENFSGKPFRGGPEWWVLDDLITWRQNKTALSFEQIQQQGWKLPADDIRTHTAINRKSQTAASGMLFQSAGLNMWKQSAVSSHPPEFSIGLLGYIDGDINPGVLHFGGERRLSGIASYPNISSQLQNDVWLEKWFADISQSQGLALTLLTPALFDQGWIPGWLNETTLIGTPPGCSRLKLKLKAAAVERWRPHSGWDLNARGSRASKKAVPAGATYWFEILDNHNADIASLWLSHLCDKEQDRLDGFGLALVFPYRWASE
ncbi:MAG: type III-B CRISPR module-associated Cmr3 family protein [Reinekea sp.]